MTIEEKIKSKRRKRGAKKRKRKELRQDATELQSLIEEITDDIEEFRQHIDITPEDEEERRQKLADRIDVLAGQKKRAKKELRNVNARLGRLDAIIGEMTDGIKRLRDKAARGRYYASEHFRISEFDCHNGQKVPTAAVPALRAWCREFGEPLRREFGEVHINSGYRPEAYNRSIGGEPNSVHIYDFHPDAVAGDFTCERGNPREWAAFLNDRADGLGTYSSFVHADNRHRIGWPTARWSG